MTSLPLITLFDQLPGGLLVTDLASRILYANQAVSERTGYALPEIIGKKPGELWGGRMPGSFYDFLWQTIGREGKPFVGRFENKPKNGERRLETLQIAPIKNEEGVTEYFIELHPEFSSGEHARDFHQRFLAEAGEWQREPALWQGFFHFLQTSERGDVLGEALQAADSLVTVIRDELVLPLQSRFTRRYEDGALIRAAQADGVAFALLYDKYIELIRLYFVRRVGVKEEAEDLSQEVFMRAYRSLPQFRVTNASYYTYLLHIAHNSLVDYYRGQTKRLREHQVSTDLLGDEFVMPHLEILDNLLASLSSLERSVMLLTYRDGYRAREIAEKIGKTENAVKLILSRSRKKLHVALR